MGLTFPAARPSLTMPSLRPLVALGLSAPSRALPCSMVVSDASVRASGLISNRVCVCLWHYRNWQITYNTSLAICTAITTYYDKNGTTKCKALLNKLKQTLNR